MSEPVIDVSELTRRFGATTALASVSVSVRRGAVHGIVGANGAGKTTLIKHVLGLLRPESGSVRVFGLDPVAEPVGVLSRIGYLSEENDLPGWMTVDELIRYTRALYPGWDDAYAEELREVFALEPAARIKTLSKGQKARAGLLIALAHRPLLLVLDEPSSGLDPIVRRDILGAVIRTIAHEGRTVLFSSHLLDEVEQVADHVTMISQGRVALSAPLPAMKASHRCVTVRFPEPRPRPPDAPGVLRWDGAGQDWVAVSSDDRGELNTAVAAWGAHIVAERSPTLDELFFAHVGVHAASDRRRRSCVRPRAPSPGNSASGSALGSIALGVYFADPVDLPVLDPRPAAAHQSGRGPNDLCLHGDRPPVVRLPVSPGRVQLRPGRRPDRAPFAVPGPHVHAAGFDRGPRGLADALRRRGHGGPVAGRRPFSGSLAVRSSSCP